MSFDGLFLRVLRFQRATQWAGLVRILQSWQPDSGSLTFQVTWWQGGWATGMPLSSPVKPREENLQDWYAGINEALPQGTGCSPFKYHLPNLSTCSSQILQSSEQDMKLAWLGTAKEKRSLEIMGRGKNHPVYGWLTIKVRIETYCLELEFLPLAVKRKQSFFIFIMGLCRLDSVLGTRSGGLPSKTFKSVKGKITTEKKKKRYGQRPGLYLRQSTTTTKITNVKVFHSIHTQIILYIMGYDKTALKLIKVCEADHQDRLTYIPKRTGH